MTVSNLKSTASSDGTIALTWRTSGTGVEQLVSWRPVGATQFPTPSAWPTQLKTALYLILSVGEPNGPLGSVVFDELDVWTSA